MPKKQDYAKRFVKGSSMVFIALLVSQLVATLLRLFLARTLDVTLYGMFYAVFIFISFFAMFRDLGIGSAVVKYIPEFIIEKKFDKIKSSVAIQIIFQVILVLPISVTLFLFSDKIATSVFGTVSASVVIKILSVWFFTQIFYQTFQGTLRGFQDMPAYASIEFLNMFFVFLLAVPLISFLGFSVKGVAYAYLGSSLVLGGLSFAYFLRSYHHVIKEKVQITKSLGTKLLKFALPVFLGGLATYILVYTDTIMITLFRTLKEVGLYQAALPTATILWYFPQAFTVILFPMISELWKKREHKILGQTLHFLIKFSFVIIIPAALVLIAFPETVLRLLFGPEYVAASATLQILAAMEIIATLLAILINTISGIGKPIIVTKVVAIMATINVIINLLLIPSIGIEGAATATFIAHVVGFSLMLYFTLKLVRFHPPTASIIKTMVGGLLTLLLIFGLKFTIMLTPWLKLFIVMIPSLLFYVIWILVTKTLTIHDLELVKRTMPSFKKLVDLAERLARH